jgi:hypothetical protein
MSYESFAFVGAVVLGLLGGGCAAQDSAGTGATEEVAITTATVTDSEGRAVSPIHTVIVGENHTISFYEPSPGDLFAQESMPQGTRSALNQFQQLDVTKILAKLAPQQAVPEKLRAAELRSLAAPVLDARAVRAASQETPDATASLTTTSGDVAKSTAALVSSSNPKNFVNTGGCEWAPIYSACRVNWSGGWWVQANATSASCTVDHYAGNGITLQKTRGASVSSSNWPVNFAGSLLWGGNGTVLHRLDILNAAGDSFHTGCQFRPSAA